MDCRQGQRRVTRRLEPPGPGAAPRSRSRSGVSAPGSRGGPGRIWETTGRQTQCGGGGGSTALPIRRLQPVKVSALLTPDCKSSSHPRKNSAWIRLLSLTVLLLLLCVGGFCTSSFLTFFSSLRRKHSLAKVQAPVENVYSYLLHSLLCICTNHLAPAPRRCS